MFYEAVCVTRDVSAPVFASLNGDIRLKVPVEKEGKRRREDVVGEPVHRSRQRVNIN